MRRLPFGYLFAAVDNSLITPFTVFLRVPKKVGSYMG